MEQEKKIQNYACSGKNDNLINEWHWKNQMSTCTRVKLDHFLMLHIKISSEGTSYYYYFFVHFVVLR